MRDQSGQHFIDEHRRGKSHFLYSEGLKFKDDKVQFGITIEEVYLSRANRDVCKVTSRIFAAVKMQMILVRGQM